MLSDGVRDAVATFTALMAMPMLSWPADTGPTAHQPDLGLAHPIATRPSHAPGSRSALNETRNDHHTVISTSS